MRFVAQKTDGGKNKGKISLYCRVLEVSRQRFYQYLSRQNRAWKHQGLADTMREIHDEDVCNKKPLEKCVTDITELKAKDGKLYVSAIFDCFDLTVLSLIMDDNMRAELCVRTLDSAAAAYPELRGAIIHSDRGSQYTSGAYRAAVEKHGIRQSMNSNSGRCHDNARCERMWTRMKCELFYDRIAPEIMTVEQLKPLIWRYFISCWNRRRICSANDGLPPVVKRQRYFAALDAAA